MKVTIPEISWHNRDPVLSIDIQTSENEEFYRLASGGADFHVLIWHLKTRESGAVDVEVVADLDRHQKAVNAVRWSPSGQYLASGSDDASIIIWSLKTDSIPSLDGETNDKEVWLVHKVLRGHKEDVYDICWSPDSLKLISGSIDNTAILWDLNKGLNEHILTDHKGFVQGVTWDPKGQYIATLGSDRICRIFDNTGKQVISRISKGCLNVPETHFLNQKEIKFFHDDTFRSYFRRLTFSPDGNLLIAPSGHVDGEDKSLKNVTYVFTLDSLTQPAVILPSPKHITIAARCCPMRFQLKENGADPYIALPYRVVIGIATDRDIIVYDTQQVSPIAHFQNVHYTRITDVTWSPNGRLLMASSSDGYITIITFELNELGIPYTKEESETEEMEVSIVEETVKIELNKSQTDNEQLETKIKKPNILEQWAIRRPKDETEPTTPKSAVKAQTSKVPQQKVLPICNAKVIKRIIPTKISEEDKCKMPEASQDKVNHAANNKRKHEETSNDTNTQEVIVIEDDSDDSSALNKSNINSSVKKRKLQSKEKEPGKGNSLVKFLKFGNNTEDKLKETNKNSLDGITSLKEVHPNTNRTDIPVHKSSEIKDKTGKCSNNDTELKTSHNCDTQITTDSNEQYIKTTLVEKENLNKSTVDDVTEIKINKPVTEETTTNQVNEIVNIKTTAPAITKTPRRVPFITLSSPKRKK